MNEIIILTFAFAGGLTIIIFLMKLLLRKNVEEIKFDPSKYNSNINERDVKIKIDKLRSKDNKIEAIKFLKDNKKGLTDAKNMIEKYVGSNTRDSMNVFDTMSSTLEDEDELISRIKALLNQGKKIDAIKLVIESSGVGLKEAKEFVESLN